MKRLVLLAIVTSTMLMGCGTTSPRSSTSSDALTFWKSPWSQRTHLEDAVEGYNEYVEDNFSGDAAEAPSAYRYDFDPYQVVRDTAYEYWVTSERPDSYPPIHKKDGTIEYIPYSEVVLAYFRDQQYWDDFAATQALRGEVIDCDDAVWDYYLDKDDVAECEAANGLTEEEIAGIRNKRAVIEMAEVERANKIASDQAAAVEADRQAAADAKFKQEWQAEWDSMVAENRKRVANGQPKLCQRVCEDGEVRYGKFAKEHEHQLKIARLDDWWENGGGKEESEAKTAEKERRHREATALPGSPEWAEQRQRGDAVQREHQADVARLKRERDQFMHELKNPGAKQDRIEREWSSQTSKAQGEREAAQQKHDKEMTKLREEKSARLQKETADRHDADRDRRNNKTESNRQDRIDAEAEQRKNVDDVIAGKAYHDDLGKAAMAICWANPKGTKYYCDGPTQRLVMPWESYAYARELVGCEGGSLRGNHAGPNTNSAEVWYCGRKLKAYDRDIASEYNVPASLLPY